MRPSGDQYLVHNAGQGAQDQCQRRGPGDWQPAISPELAEDDGRQTHERADRQVNATAGDHRRQGHGQQADLDTQAQHLKGIGQREEVGADYRENHDLDRQQSDQDPLSRLQPEPSPGGVSDLDRFG